MKHFSLPLSAALVLAAPAFAQPADDFYRGKTITLVVGMAPPDQHDNDGRALARHIGKYIPGNPAIIVQNMPGAGALKAAQYIAAHAPKDGLTFGILQRGVYLMPLLGFPDANYDPLKFSFIGARSPETSITVTWRESKAKTLADARRQEVVLASAGGGGDGNVLPFLYNETLGTKFKVIGGYPGGGDMNLAVERREVDGRGGWSMGAMRGTRDDWWREKKVNIILQHALFKHRDLADVPLAQESAKNASDRALLELFGKQQGVGFAFVAPPGVPADRMAALRLRANDARSRLPRRSRGHEGRSRSIVGGADGGADARYLCNAERRGGARQGDFAGQWGEPELRALLSRIPLPTG